VRLFDAKQWQGTGRYRSKMLDMVEHRIGTRWAAMGFNGKSGMKGAGDDAVAQLVAWGLFANDATARATLKERFLTLRVRPDYENCDVLYIAGHAWMDVAIVAKEKLEAAEACAPAPQ